MKRPPHSQDLRIGRHSDPGARYFITFNIKEPSESLSTPQCYQAFKRTIQDLEQDNVLQAITFVLMPDHVHILFRLGRVLELGKAISRLKLKSRKASEPTRIYWQSNYRDHKLRSDKDLHPILHYIYLNPYRANLLQAHDTWPYLFVREKEWGWFRPLLDKECPYPEWLAD